MEIKLKKYDAYKNSGVEWLGEIPEHWEVTSIKKVGLVKNGATPSSSNLKYWDGDIVWVTPTDINNLVTIVNSERKISTLGYQSCGTTLIPKGSIVLTTRAPIGKVVIAGVNLCTNQGCKSIIANNQTNSKFLYYLFSINSKILNGLGTGTTFLELSNKELKNFNLPNPPLKEQTAIAKFLDNKTAKIDQAITIKQKQIGLLKERRQILIHKAVTQGINPNVKLKDSGVEWIGEIPEHWEVKRLKHVVKINNGSDYKHIQSESGYPVIGSGGIFAYATEFMYDGEVLFLGRKGTIDKPLYFKGKFWAVDTMFYAQAKYKNSVRFLHYLATTIPFKFYSTATALPSMTQSDLNNHPIVIPNVNEQNLIVKYLEDFSLKIDTAISLKEKEIEKLKEYKASLINSVVTGKVKIS
ncbi:restriction endonuclease subunit S [Pedobacter sandarakinus]|uniref:restriction endonuclease subunit S n=1 Tax=Pedobacter sandarakinus TaxID=353156 RepID=UPI00224658FD|nr:restriction endonuclease subunit S [Pedobacter sandarakinus]MCX2574073.1 restriction endonuclease subunit S [Pedobacter sandarakinus]